MKTLLKTRGKFFNIKTLLLSGVLVFNFSCSDDNSGLVEHEDELLTEGTKELVAPYSARVTPVDGGVYTLTNVKSGRVVSVLNGSNANGANIVVSVTDSNTSATNRQWEVLSVGGSYVRLKSVDSGKSMTVANGSNSNGANVRQWAYNGSDNHEWEILSVGDGLFRLKGRDSGKSLRCGGTSAGSSCDQWAYRGWDSQKFYFTQVGGSSGGGNSGGGNSGGNTPGAIMGLTNDDWKLNGFTASPSSSATYYDDVMDQINGNIATWTNNNYFFENNGWAYFKCYRGLGSSENSNNPRVELRELNGNGGNASWNGDNGSHVMSFTVRVDQLPVGYDDDENENRSTGTLCFAQIHGPSGTNSNGVDVDDTIRVQFEGSAGQSSGSVKMKISGYITEEQGGGSETIDGFSLDTSYNMQLRFINDRVSVVVNGNEVFGRTMNTAGNGSYFKIGNYLQSVQNANYTGSFGLVGFKNLSVSHP